ncbi:hypothetical protein MK852_09835 [Shewanella benthica]|nr:hypothetical protein [Shewanella benthica]
MLGTEDTDKRATEILDGFGSDTKEQAMVVMRDGTSVSPSSCTNKGCSFDVDLKKVLFAAHTHVESDNQHSGIAKLITKKREMPGPGDHAFPTLAGAPNYILTPKGAVRVLEFKSGKYQVRTLRGTGASTDWSPADATPSKSEIRRALKR